MVVKVATCQESSEFFFTVIQARGAIAIAKLIDGPFCRKQRVDPFRRQPGTTFTNLKTISSQQNITGSRRAQFGTNLVGRINP